eukprot:jgi/Bigna1/77725/fgenesh1_pg.50_\
MEDKNNNLSRSTNPNADQSAPLSKRQRIEQPQDSINGSFSNQAMGEEESSMQRSSTFSNLDPLHREWSRENRRVVDGADSSFSVPVKIEQPGYPVEDTSVPGNSLFNANFDANVGSVRQDIEFQIVNPGSSGNNNATNHHHHHVHPFGEQQHNSTVMAAKLRGTPEEPHPAGFRPDGQFIRTKSETGPVPGIRNWSSRRNTSYNEDNESKRNGGRMESHQTDVAALARSSFITRKNIAENTGKPPVVDQQPPPGLIQPGGTKKKTTTNKGFLETIDQSIRDVMIEMGYVDPPTRKTQPNEEVTLRSIEKWIKKDTRKLAEGSSSSLASSALSHRGEISFYYEKGLE